MSDYEMLSIVLMILGIVVTILMKSLIPQLCWGEWSKQERVRYQ